MRIAGETDTLDHDGVLHETDVAVLFDIDGEERWVPKSVMEDWDGSSATVAVWWLHQAELI